MKTTPIHVRLDDHKAITEIARIRTMKEGRNVSLKEVISSMVGEAQGTLKTLKRWERRNQ